MARVGFLLIAGVLLAAALIFALHPWLDLDVALRFFGSDPGRKFPLVDNSAVKILRQVNLAVPAVLFAVVMTFMAIQLNRPRARIFIPPGVGLFLIAVIALGPGLLVNGLLKPFWPRPRPGSVLQAGGSEPFVAWWDIGGTCPGNCSFVSGEVSVAFALLAVAAVMPAALRYGAFAAVLVYGSAIAFVRIAAGAHFLSDVIFAGSLTALVVWLLHGAFFRWSRFAISAAVADAFARELNAMIVTLGRLVAGQISLMLGGFVRGSAPRA